jgi:hypothetical protein
MTAVKEVKSHMVLIVEASLFSQRAAVKEATKFVALISL